MTINHAKKFRTRTVGHFFIRSHGFAPIFPPSSQSGQKNIILPVEISRMKKIPRPSVCRVCVCRVHRVSVYTQRASYTRISIGAVFFFFSFLHNHHRDFVKCTALTTTMCRWVFDGNIIFFWVLYDLGPPSQTEKHIFNGRNLNANSLNCINIPY